MPLPVEYQMMKATAPTVPFDRPSSFDEATKITSTDQVGLYKVQLKADWAFGPSTRKP